MFRHALRRSLILIFLGIFLRSMNSPTTYWTFEDTLTQIGLGYTFLFLLAFAPVRAQVGVFVAILVGFWAAFVLYPLPPARLRLPGRGRAGRLAAPLHGLPRALQQEREPGVGLRHLVPQPLPARVAVRVQRRRLVHAQLRADAGDDDARDVGGDMAEVGRRRRARSCAAWSSRASRSRSAAVVLQWLRICPIVKRIWTSSYTLYSGGLVLLMLAAIFYAAIKGWTQWSFSLLVIGANSITAYVMSWTIEHFVADNLVRHFGRAPFLVLGRRSRPRSAARPCCIVFWLILYWLYKKRVFVRI